MAQVKALSNVQGTSLTRWTGGVYRRKASNAYK